MDKINEKPDQVTFMRAFKDFWLGYFDFLGRSTRAGYWWMQLILWIIFLPLVLIGLGWLFYILMSTWNGSITTKFPSLAIVTVIVVLVGIAIFIPTLALTVRRFRDAGLRGRGFLVLVGAVCFFQIGLQLFMIMGENAVANQTNNGFLSFAMSQLIVIPMMISFAFPTFCFVYRSCQRIQ